MNRAVREARRSANAQLSLFSLFFPQIISEQYLDFRRNPGLPTPQRMKEQQSPRLIGDQRGPVLGRPLRRSTPMERIPASERTREKLKAVIEGSGKAGGTSQLVRLAARLIIEEAL